MVDSHLLDLVRNQPQLTLPLVSDINVRAREYLKQMRPLAEDFSWASNCLQSTFQGTSTGISRRLESASSHGQKCIPPVDVNKAQNTPRMRFEREIVFSELMARCAYLTDPQTKKAASPCGVIAGLMRDNSADTTTHLLGYLIKRTPKSLVLPEGVQGNQERADVFGFIDASTT